MARYIDADILLDKLYDHEFITLCPLDEVSDVIDYCPTVDAESVRHGHWIMADEYCNHAKEFQCSACGNTVEYDYYTSFCEYDFCPHCGAKMDEVQ